MASIAEWIQRIKTAIYGEEVRGAIWQSLQAMNDELTSADVTQIPKNKQDIEGLKTDVTNLKASDTEMKDIRVGADGTQYETAGKAVRTQISDLKADLSINNASAIFADGYFLTTVGSVVDINSPSSAGGWSYAIMPCADGDTLLISAGAYSNPCQYAFLDENYKCIYRSGEVSDKIENNIVTAIKDSAYVLVNNNSSMLPNDKRKLYNLFSHGSDINYAIDKTANELVNINSLNLRSLFENRGRTKTYGGVTISIDDCGIITITGKASYTFIHSLIEQTNTTFFRAGEKYVVSIDGTLIPNYLAVQIKIKRTESSSEEALLTAWSAGDYIISMPEPLYYAKIDLVCFNSATVDSVLKIDVCNTDSVSVFKTSQFNGSLIQAVKTAQKRYGSTVIIDSGEIDIVSDFISYYGESFFTSYDHTKPDGWGLVITNGLTLKGLSNAVITCDTGQYQSTTNDIATYFSPLMLAGDCSLENIKIISANTKYCVHDDWMDKTVTARHEYHNCVMIKNDTLNRCLGGGLSNSSEIIVENCYFKDNTNAPVSFHNCVNANAQSRIVICGNYFENGGVRLAHYGASTNKTTAYIHGNSYKVAPNLVFESASYSTENMEFIAYNNEIRG